MLSAHIDSWIQQTIEFAQKAFPELRNVGRERITLEVHSPLLGHTQQTTVGIGRMVWAVLVPTLARFEIVEVCVAAAPQH